MDPDMYTAAMDGELDVLNRYTDRFALQVTPNKNTVLHVVAEFGHSHCVADILNKCPSLLCLANTHGDTPLHIAAAGGYKDVVQSLIDFAKSQVDNQQNVIAAANNGRGCVPAVVTEMLRATNRDGDTPFHLAARSKAPLGIVSLLTRADQWLDYGPNEAGETPLYLVLEQQEYYKIDVVSEILENCKSLAYGGPGGRTAMHAAVVPSWEDDEVLNKLLEWREDLIEEPDSYGWTPIHLAARYDNLQVVKTLLKKNKSVAYIATNNGDRETALHISAAVGAVSIMNEFLSTCPDCWEMVNGKGQNILHIAADLGIDDAAACILEKPWVSRLINRKDNDGNTPLHVLASNGKIGPHHVLASKGKKWLFEYPGADTFVFNKETLTPKDIQFYEASNYWPRETWDNPRDTVRKDQECIIKWKMSRNERRKERKERIENRKKERDEEMSKMAKTHMIVATLISTISFAAGFTIPGGYDGNQGPNQGMAVLVREAAFKAFVITNTIAVICSTSSVFLYVSAAIFSSDYGTDKRSHRYTTAFWLIIIAMVAMILAFITGTYTVLAHSSGLGIVISVIACSSFIVYAFELTRLLDWDFLFYKLRRWFRV